MILDDIELAKELEEKQLWRRAARQWLTVMDRTNGTTERGLVATRRSICLSRARIATQQYSGVRVMTAAGGVLND
ncbi:PerC family transcriptional regulator [Pectobacterium aroidearum]|uniref:PerC family transcriptional regulator n=1 Tax=Pectobacterium aroidearum TaxID=1201031 RepID=UPI0032EFA8E9